MEMCTEKTKLMTNSANGTQSEFSIKGRNHGTLISFKYQFNRGWSGGAMVLCKLPVPGRSANLGYSRARAYCACRGCGWGLFGHFFSRPSFLFSFSISLGDGSIYTEILFQRAIKPKTTNQQPVQQLSQIKA